MWYLECSCVGSSFESYFQELLWYHVKKEDIGRGNEDTGWGVPRVHVCVFPNKVPECAVFFSHLEFTSNCDDPDDIFSLSRWREQDAEGSSYIFCTWVALGVFFRRKLPASISGYQQSIVVSPEESVI